MRRYARENFVPPTDGDELNSNLQAIKTVVLRLDYSRLSLKRLQLQRKPQCNSMYIDTLFESLRHDYGNV